MLKFPAGAWRRIVVALALLTAAIPMVARAQSQVSDALWQRLGPGSPLAAQPFTEYVRRAGVAANLCDISAYREWVRRLRELVGNAARNTGRYSTGVGGVEADATGVTDPVTRTRVGVSGSQLGPLQDAIGRLLFFEQELARHCADRDARDPARAPRSLRSPESRADQALDGLPQRPADPRAAADADVASLEESLRHLVDRCARDTYLARIRAAIAAAERDRAFYSSALRAQEVRMADARAELARRNDNDPRGIYAETIASAGRAIETLRRLIESKSLEIPRLQGLLLTADERFAHCTRDRIATADARERDDERAALFLIANPDQSNNLASLERECDRDDLIKAYDSAIAQVAPTLNRTLAGQPAAAREAAIAQARRGLEERKRRALEEMARRCRPAGSDIATPPAPPIPGGLTLEPMILFGSRTNRADGVYRSTGAQAPGAGRGDKTDVNACGAVQGWVSLADFARLAGRAVGGLVVLGKTEAGLRFGVCHLGSGEKIVFKEVRHPGSDGNVTLSERERTEIKLYLMLRQTFLIDIGGLFGRGTAFLPGDQFAATELAQGTRAAPAPNYWPVALYVGGGPSFVSSTIAIVSNQSGGGGAVESARQVKTDTAWGLVVGAQTALCRDCVLGSPLMVGVEGGWLWLPARDINLRSSAFGFTETGRVSARNSTRVMFTISVPFRVLD